jgi:hypothetical protein
MIDGVPIQSVLLLFVVEEAVMLVENLPQCLEVARRCVFILIGIDAGDRNKGNSS